MIEFNTLLILFILSVIIIGLGIIWVLVLLYKFDNSKKPEPGISQEGFENETTVIKTDIQNISNQANNILMALGNFDKPLNSLNTYLSGGTKAGAVSEWGLEAIISEILPSNGYEKDYMIHEDSRERVEFAIKIPGGLYLPIDSKFHSKQMDKYNELMEASQEGEGVREDINKIRKQIIDTVKGDAADINNKYMQDGITIDLGVMFIMSENFVQVLDSPDFTKRNEGMNLKEEIFRDYRVLILGPNTLASYISSLHMSFRNLALNKEAKKVVQGLGVIKSEFKKYSESTRLLVNGAQQLLNRAEEQKTRAKKMEDALEEFESFEETTDEIKGE